MKCLLHTIVSLHTLDITMNVGSFMNVGGSGKTLPELIVLGVS